MPAVLPLEVADSVRTAPVPKAEALTVNFPVEFVTSELIVTEFLPVRVSEVPSVAVFALIVRREIVEVPAFAAPESIVTTS